MKKIAEEAKKFFGQIKNTKLLVIIFIIGIGLMLVPGENKGNGKKNGAGEDGFSLYKSEMENELEKALATVEGAGSVKVLITLADNGENYIATDEKNGSSTKGEENTGNGEKTYVLKNDDGGGQSPVVLKKSMPRISGVLIIAEGAENQNLKNELTYAVKALLGVHVHRIYVLPKK